MVKVCVPWCVGGDQKTALWSCFSPSSLHEFGVFSAGCQVCNALLSHQLCKWFKHFCKKFRFTL